MKTKLEKGIPNHKEEASISPKEEEVSAAERISDGDLEKKIKKIDKIVSNFSFILNNSNLDNNVVFEVENLEDSKQVKIELEKLKKEAETNISNFDDKLEVLKSFLNTKMDLADSDFSRSITDIIVDLNKNINLVDESCKKGNKLEEDYKEKVLLESGFKESNDIWKEIDNLYEQRRIYTEKFGGRIRFIKEIKAIDSKRNSLENIQHNQYSHIDFSQIDYSKKNEFKDLENGLYSNYLNEIFSDYESILKKDKEERLDSKKLDPTIIESLENDYISKSFDSDIKKEILKWGAINGDYKEKYLEILTNQELINEARSLFKEELDQINVSYRGLSEEEEIKRSKFREKLNALPYTLSNIIEQYTNRNEITTEDEFNKFVSFTEENLSMVKVLSSFNKGKEDFSKFSDSHINLDLYYKVRKIESLFQPEDMNEFLKKINMDKWEVFKNSKEIDKLYGKDVLNSADKTIENMIFNQLLVMPDHSDESVNLGYKALNFKDPVAVSYNILNFWREGGYSGEMPFLSVHSNPKDNICTHYVNSLTNEEIKEVGKLNIPGLMEIIDTIRKNPNNFRDKTLDFNIKISDRVDNPIYHQVKGYLKEINQYYLNNGNEKEKIYSIYCNKDDEFGGIKTDCLKIIFDSYNPIKTYKEILKLNDELKNYEKLNGISSLRIKYISMFVGNEKKEEEEKFVSFVEDICKNIPDDTLVANFDYLNEKYLGLPEGEFQNRLVEFKPMFTVLDNLGNFMPPLLRGFSFENLFELFNSYNVEEKKDMIKLAEMNGLNFSNTFNENDYTENIISYINNKEDLNLFKEDEDRKEKVIDIFDGNYKDLALKMMSNEWRSYLNSDKKNIPPNLYIISKLIDDAGGAGNLKHFESLGNLIKQVNDILQNPETADKTKNEIKDLLGKQEIRFDKEKLSQDDRSEFYNLSNDILKASPSLYSAFSPIFESMSPKDMKIFLKEIFPYYQAELVIIQEMGNNGEAKYKPRELVEVRNGIKNFIENFKQSNDGMGKEKDRLLEIVRDGFKNRFGLLKVPEEFSKENLRSIQNGIRYIGNISGRDTKKETLISFYLGLEINNEWDSFRQGKEINIEDYFSGKQLDIIKPLIEEKKKSYESLSKILGIREEQMPKFQEILQEETIGNMIGNIETVDTKLENVRNNVLELIDPDIYENDIDKGIMELLSKEGKSVGVVLAKTYGEISGKNIPMSIEEKILQSKIASIFEVESWSVDKVKQIQDTIQPLNLISSMVNKMEEEKVNANIQELQKRLRPTAKIIEIFSRLGEEFKQESGAMALSKDLTYLESLIVKDDKKIIPEEKEEINLYLNSIKDKMKDLEITLDKVKEFFDKIKSGSHFENNLLLKNRLDEIEKIIYSTNSNDMIVSHMTKDLNLIIENMRQCLGCMHKEVNNDTNLAFGDYNKFFMINQGEKSEKGSISDEIIFFAPIKNSAGEEEMSFVLDRVYGSKSSDILISNILSVYKKYNALKKGFPEAHLSISVSDEAMSSAGLNSEILKKRLSDILKNATYLEESKDLIADIPKSAFSDNYVEFGIGNGARKSGERSFSGLVLR